MKNISILGSTGSIGVNSLDVISKNSDRFNVVALSAGRNIELLKAQIKTFRPLMACVIDEDYAKALRNMLEPSIKVNILSGQDGYCSAATFEGTDLVISAMVGAAGLLPTIAGIEAGIDVALANKETMVIAGEIVMEKAKSRGVRILPVDSEHSAVFQCLEGQNRASVKRIILTASGGPFLHMPIEEIRTAGPEQALRHPNWSMGRKITIDSATMMNKGLEIIEARWLFEIPFEKIDALIHPQSIIHSMVEYKDGSVIAQLGQPDMRIPIAYALSYPDRMAREGSSLDFSSMAALTFAAPDDERFPCLELAKRAGKIGATMPAVLNAANEIAVEQFLERKIAFSDIHRVVKAIMEESPPSTFSPSIQDILEADREARKKTRDYIEELVK